MSYHFACLLCVLCVFFFCVLFFCVCACVCYCIILGWSGCGEWVLYVVCPVDSTLSLFVCSPPVTRVLMSISFRVHRYGFLVIQIHVFVSLSHTKKDWYELEWFSILVLRVCGGGWVVCPFESVDVWWGVVELGFSQVAKPAGWYIVVGCILERRLESRLVLWSTPLLVSKLM